VNDIRLESRELRRKSDRNELRRYVWEKSLRKSINLRRSELAAQARLRQLKSSAPKSGTAFDCSAIEGPLSRKSSSQ
jgi:hypothetical protein